MKGPNEKDVQQAYSMSRNLKLSSNILGNAGDSLSYHNGMMFTTKDRDNDKNKNDNCATTRKGAWWFNNCARSNLNGQYMKIKWQKWKNNSKSTEKVEMKIRPIQF